MYWLKLEPNSRCLKQILKIFLAFSNIYRKTGLKDKDFVFYQDNLLGFLWILPGFRLFGKVSLHLNICLCNTLLNDHLWTMDNTKTIILSDSNAFSTLDIFDKKCVELCIWNVPKHCANIFRVKSVWCANWQQVPSFIQFALQLGTQHIKCQWEGSGEEGERMREGAAGRNDPNNVCICE
jgi:hypothetical protein